MQNPDDGATKVPDTEDTRKGECLGQYKHKGEWIWEDGIMTDRVRCMNCAKVWVKTFKRDS